MATVKELFNRTNKIVDDEYDNADLIDWFNQCQNEALSTVLYIPTTTELPLNISGSYDLPSNYKDSLVIVNNNNTFDIYGKELRVYGTKPNLLKIEYNKLPSKITSSPDQVPDVPEPFHDLYIFYGAMMAMLLEEEHERYMVFREQFIMALTNLKEYTANRKAERLSHKTAVWVVIR